MRQKKKNTLLTEVELEFMTAIWEINGGTVREVMANLAPDRALAYTSASTILRILEQKEFLISERAEKSFIYRPTINKPEYQSKSLRNLSEKLFDSTPSSLVARLVDDENMSEEMLQEIRALLDKRLGKNAD
ncbi:MAG: BlaI/MecI/CopY family transcriptional regulator [Rhodobacteraceae bacterium]|nr:BlaI/MecI/CopY family transcriptional regulator [Paracoccaceae bacterium]